MLDQANEQTTSESQERLLKKRPEKELEPSHGEAVWGNSSLKGNMDKKQTRKNHQ